MKHPRRKVRLLRAELKVQREVNRQFYRLITEARRELGHLDGGRARDGWTLAHRLRVYQAELRYQPKADETGKPVRFVCLAGPRAPWDYAGPAWSPETPPHQHMVYPSNWDGLREPDYVEHHAVSESN